METSFPLNIIKEKMLLSLPHNTPIENSALVGLNSALKDFLSEFAKDLNAQIKTNNEKKGSLKDIKETIEANGKYAFMTSLIEQIKENK